MSEQRHLPLVVGFLMMTASVCTGQVNTAKPGEQAERHLSSDQTMKQWSLTPNQTDDVKRIKVCRVETVCKMRFKDGQTPRTRVKNLVMPLRYEDETIPISDAFTKQDPAGARQPEGQAGREGPFHRLHRRRAVNRPR